MTRHVSTGNLARFLAGDLGAARSRRIAAHLRGCERCRQASDALAQIPARLAAANVPQMPAHLAARIETALATEAARQATAAPRTAAPGGAGPRAAHRHRARRPVLAMPAARILAAAAALVVVVGGGGYGLSRLAGGTSGASSASSGSKSVNGAGALRPSARHAPGAGTPMIASPPRPGRYGPLLHYRAAGQAAAVRPVLTGTSYQPGRLGQQAAQALVRERRAQATAPEPQAANSPLSTAQARRLAGCVSRVAAGRTVLLVDVAKYGGAPATIIVTAAGGGRSALAWAVGQGCSASASDVLARRPLPATTLPATTPPG